MAELLDRIHSEIRERLDASRAAVLEYELLEAALAALGEPEPAPRRARRPRRAEPAAAVAAAPLQAAAETPPAAAGTPGLDSAGRHRRAAAAGLHRSAAAAGLHRRGPRHRSAGDRRRGRGGAARGVDRR